MLVQRTIAQLVELRAGPPATQQAQGTEAVRDQGDRICLQADQFFLQSRFAARGLDGLSQCCKRNGVAADETFRDERAQKRTRIVG